MEILPLVAKPPRPKSPNTPAYSLQECLKDARKVFRVENQGPPAESPYQSI